MRLMPSNWIEIIMEIYCEQKLGILVIKINELILNFNENIKVL